MTWDAAAALALSLATGPVCAEAPGGNNLHPPQSLFGFPGGYLDGPLPDTWRIGGLSQTASISMREQRGGESLALDGETTEIRLFAERRIGADWSLAVEVPYRWHESGGLDTFIDTWHKVFGLPEGVRGRRPQDQLALSYSRDGTAVFAIDGSTRGVGDVLVTARRAVRPNWVASAAVKLPTGDARKLTGSGGLDLTAGLWWHSAQPVELAPRFSAAAGLAYLGESDLDLPRQRSFGWFAQAGIEVGVSNAITLGGRLQVTSAVADSALGALGDPSIMLVLGGEIALPNQLGLALSVSEDINVDTAPDVTFNIGLQWRVRN